VKASLRYLIPVVLVVMAVSSCDCENRMRKLVSNSGDRKQQVEEAKKRRQMKESSAPQEQEPNGVLKQATLFELGGDLRPIEAAIGDADDTDWYALTSRNGESWQIEITVKPTSDQLDPVIRVAVNGAEDSPTEYDVSGLGDEEAVPNLSVSSAPQYISVSGKDGATGEYTMSFQKRLTGGAVETEPNDSVDAATRFEAPGEIQGFYDRPDDRDVYFIPIKDLTGDVFQFEVSPVDDVVQQVRLFTHRTMESAYVSFQVPPTKSAGLPNLALPEDVLGVWVVLTAGKSFSRTTSYRIKLLGHPPTEQAVEAEPNDDAETAQKIELGTKLVGYFHMPEDVDHFRLYVDGLPDDDKPAQDTPAQGTAQSGDVSDAGPPSDPTDDQPADQLDATDAGSDAQAPDPLAAVAEKTPPEHVVRVSVSPTHQKARLALAWTDPDTNTASSVESSEPGESVTLCNRVIESGYLDLEVRPGAMPDDRMQGGYDYGLTTDDVADQVGLEIEPNDSRDQADKLTAESERIGYIGRPADVDVFAFAVPHPEPNPDPDAWPSAPSEPKSVELVVEASPLNLGFELLDDEGGRVAEVNRAGAGSQEKLRIDLPPGLYFVHVSAKRGFACEPYRIKVRVDQ
jgi:hypothetical protein